MVVGGLLAGKSALITGSASLKGLGYGILKTLAAAGCNVGMHGIMDPAQLALQSDAVAAEFGVQAAYSTANLTKPAEIRPETASIIWRYRKSVDAEFLPRRSDPANHDPADRRPHSLSEIDAACIVSRDMMAKMHDRFGGIDILVNNAGIQFVAPVHEFPEDKWDAIISVCLTSAFHTTKAVLPYMLQQKWGRIINTGSMHSLVASPYKSAYNAAKHGLAGLTKTVALENAQTGVTCNAICPGYMFTELIEKQLKSQAQIRGISEDEVVSLVLLADQPSKQFVGTDEVGAFVAFLCSDAARSVTGSTLSIDGGWTAR